MFCSVIVLRCFYWIRINSTVERRSPFMTDEIQLPAIQVFRGDFKLARRFALRILHARWHTKTRTDLVELTHHAFNLSLVVTYARPFFNNQHFSGGPSSLKHCVTTVLLDPSDIALHDKACRLRNTAYAHSDGSSHLVPGWDYNRPVVALMQFPFQPLDESETRRMLKMTKRWLEYLEQERLARRASPSRQAQQIVGREPR